MVSPGAPALEARRLGFTAGDLILALLVIVTAALLVAAVSASGPEQTTRRAVTVQQLSAAYHGPSALVGALNGGEARSRALGRADLDADGAPDLVAGYAWHGNGIVTVQRGDHDAFAPKRDSVLEQMQQGFDPELVQPSALVVRVPEPVGYVETGDFNRDKRPDVLVAARRGGLYLLAGDGKGGLGQARRISLPGPVTTVAAGEFRAADGLSDVAVGVDARKGPELLVFDGKRRSLATPMRFSLPGSATSIEFGSLDPDPYLDLAVAAGGRLRIVHGWGRKQLPALASRVERVAHVSGVRAISIGYFMRDRDGRNEIAAAFSDGTVRLLIPGDLDTRPPTAKTIQRRAAARVKGTRVKPQEAESKPAWRSSTSSGWDVGPSIARGAGGTSPQNLLTSGKISLLDTDDLLVAKAAGGFDLVPATVSTGGSQKPTRKVAAAVNELNAAVDAPTAVLPMPQTAIGNRGMVVVGDDAVSPTVVILAASTLTVDRTDDPSGAALTAASACTAAANDCSLRGAVQFANNPANAGSTIVLGANTYTLSINGDRGCVGGGEPAATGNTVGDLEINQSTTITGAGSDQTIIRQTGTGSATAPGDRVMCLNTGFLVGLQYNFSGLTITGGREGGTVGGGGIIGGELNNALTLSGVRLSNNQDSNSGLGGGGIQLTGGNLTITNSLIGGTSPPCTAASSATCNSGTDRNNVNLANSVQTSGGGVNYTPSSPMHAGGTGTLTVTGTTITRNTASGVGGGGFDLAIFAFASPGGIGSGSANISTSTISNNQGLGTGPGGGTTSGGGIVVESLPTTVASTAITSNSTSASGGGIFVGGGGLTLDGTSAPGVTFSGNTAAGGGSTIATTFNVTVQGTNVTLGGDVLIGGNGNWTNSPGSVISPTNVTIRGGTFNANDSTTNMSGNLTFGPTPGNEIAFPGTFNSGTGTFNFNGSGAQSIIGPNSPTFNNLVVNKPSGTLTLSVNSPVKSNLTVSSGVFDLGAFTANRTTAGGTLTVSNGATLKIGGTNSLPTNYATYALGTTSTVEYAGTGAQTITATNYGHLTSSSTGARTLPSGQTVGVAGAFTPGTNTYTVTGSAVNFNGAGAQTIPAFNYNNLTSSSTGARTLASSGTVGVAGAFTPGTNAYTVTGSTVNFNGAGAQTIPAFGYNNLTSSSTGARTLAASGTIGVAGAFTPGANAYTVTSSTVNFNGAGAQTIPAFGYNNLTSSSTGARTLASSGTVGVAGAFTPGSNVYTVTGSTVNFNGSGPQTIPAFTFNNLTDANTGGAVSLAAAITVNGALTVNANALLDTTAFVLTLNGTYTNNGQIRHSHNQNLSTTAGPFNFADGLGVQTVRLSGLSAAFGSTTANTAAGGSNPYNSCGALPANAVRRFWQITPATTGTGVARFSFRDDEVAGGLSTGQLAIYRCAAGGGSWTQVGTTYTDPAPTGPLPGYSSVEASGVPFASTGQTYVVAQGQPELTVLKTNNVSGATTVGNPWTWTLRVANGGRESAAFAAGQTILSDNLPNSDISYGTVGVANIGSGVIGGGNISCAIASNNLTCLANGGPVTLGTNNGSFDVAFTATPTSAVTFTNPRSGGSCSVDPNNNSAESNEGNNACSDTVTVVKANTTTTITSDDPDPSAGGEAVSVDFTVVAAGAGTPTGNVTVSDGVDSCTGTVAAGSCEITLTTVGARMLTAAYEGDTSFKDSASAGEPHTVERFATTTSITSDAPDPSDVGEVVTVDFSVSENAAGTPTGDVTVSDGVDECTATVAAGSCALTLSNAGSRPLTASYEGDSAFKDSTSAPEPHTVDGTDTTTTITSDEPDPSVVGEPVSVEYEVAATGGGTPAGNVRVSDGVDECTGTVAAGSCEITLTTAGTRSLTATYAAAGTFDGSESAVEPHTVDRASTTTTIKADSPDPSGQGAPVTVDYEVKVDAPGAGAPSGNVTVSDGVDECTAPVSEGRCTLSLTTAGGRTLTASYAGDSRFAASSSGGEAHTVNPAAPGTPGTPGAPTLVHVSNASQTHAEFRVSRRPQLAQGSRRRTPVGTTFKFKLDGAAQVRFRFVQPRLGRKVNGKCVARNRRNTRMPKCALRRGSMNFAGHAGLNSVRFKGWLSRKKKLTPGKYTLVIEAITPGIGTTSQKLRFTVLR